MELDAESVSLKADTQLIPPLKQVGSLAQIRYKGRPWYLNGYAEVFVLALVPLTIILTAFLK